MFTGIIQAVGRIRDNEEIGDGLRIHVEAPELGLDTVKIGDSIAINGACMTVVEVDEKKFKVEVSAESLSKTAGLDGWGYVNLEKAMRLGDRLDGHIVSGHVDGTGTIREIRTDERYDECRDTDFVGIALVSLRNALNEFCSRYRKVHGQSSCSWTFYLHYFYYHVIYSDSK